MFSQFSSLSLFLKLFIVYVKIINIRTPVRSYYTFEEAKNSFSFTVLIYFCSCLLLTDKFNLSFFFSFLFWLDVPHLTNEHRTQGKSAYCQSSGAHNIKHLWKLTLKVHLNTDVKAELKLGTLFSRERCLNSSATALNFSVHPI